MIRGAPQSCRPGVSAARSGRARALWVVLGSHRAARSWGRSPIQNRLRQGAAVDVLQLATGGQTLRDACHRSAAGAEQLAEVVGGRLALVGEVGGEDDLPHRLILRPLQQSIEVELARSDAVERREASHQHEVQSLVALRLLHHRGGPQGFRRHRARRHRDARSRTTGRPCSSVKVLHRSQWRMRSSARSRHAASASPPTIALEQVVSHALGRFRSDAGQTTQRFMSS